jgi:hypothetical protein
MFDTYLLDNRSAGSTRPIARRRERIGIFYGIN